MLPDRLVEELGPLKEVWLQSFFLWFLLPQPEHSWRRTHPGWPPQDVLFHLLQVLEVLPLFRLPELMFAAAWSLLLLAWKKESVKSWSVPLCSYRRQSEWVCRFLDNWDFRSYSSNIAQGSLAAWVAMKVAWPIIKLAAWGTREETADEYLNQVDMKSIKLGRPWEAVYGLVEGLFHGASPGGLDASVGQGPQVDETTPG